MIADLTFAFRQLRQSPGFTAVVVTTLALGIGANARHLHTGAGRPHQASGQSRRASADLHPAERAGDRHRKQHLVDAENWGLGKSRVKTLSAFGDFSTVPFTMIGLGEPREVNGGVVNESYFDVMGLRPVLGRLVGPEDDGPKAAGVVVLTYRFWSNSLKRDPSVIGKTVNLGGVGGDRSATIIGVLEPSVPYPQETESSPTLRAAPSSLGNHGDRAYPSHDGAFLRVSRLEITLDQARAELRSVLRHDGKRSSRGLLEAGKTFRSRPSCFATK